MPKTSTLREWLMAQAAAYAAYPSANRPLIAATLAANLARYRLEPQ